MNIRELNFFLTLCKTQNYAIAAELCAISPSTLTRCIQRLELHFSCELFERNTKKVSVTKEGKIVEEYATKILFELEDLQKKLLESSNSQYGQIKLYCSVTASYFIIPRLLSIFKEQFPKIEIKLETGDAALAIGKILSNNADLAIAAKPDIEFNNIIFKHLKTIPLVFIGPVNRKFDLNNLNSVPIIFPQHGLLRKRLENWFIKNNITPNIYAEVSGNEAIVSMVALGCGISAVPKEVINQNPVGVNIEIINMQNNLQPFEVVLCMNAKRSNESILKSFWDIAR